MAGKCPMCGHDMSPTAKKCFHCGYDREELMKSCENSGCSTNLIVFGIILIFAVILFGVIPNCTGR